MKYHHCFNNYRKFKGGEYHKMNVDQSISMFSKAKQMMPGGVNSPIRAFRAVGLVPPFIKSAKGSRIYDVDGNEYIDYVGSWGAMILGHSPDEVIASIIQAARNGTNFGMPTEPEIELAGLIHDAMPGVEMVRMVNSDTEAVMCAIRLARGYTGRDKILKFEGCYHGHGDGLLVKAGSGVITAGVPDSAGVPIDYARNTLIASYNNIEELESIFKTCGNSLAAVIIEPVAANMGLVLPEPEFLKRLRKLTLKYGVLLIFDETITGFRVSYHGAQGYYGITPDLTTLGRVIGGGIPAGAFGGRAEIMSYIAPSGPVYQAGTFSGNPVAVAAGIATLKILKNNPSIYGELERKTAKLESAIVSLAQRYGVELTVNRIGSLFCPYFTSEKVTDYETAVNSDIIRFAAYFKSLLGKGIFMAPSQFEVVFVSYAHSDEDIERTIQAIDQTLNFMDFDIHRQKKVVLC
jgi:glutamate-1-semialdehyde 2,1-aminomutase